eukprot:4034893-Amphidinium_carterae.1
MCAVRECSGAREDHLRQDIVRTPLLGLCWIPQEVPYLAVKSIPTGPRPEDEDERSERPMSYRQAFQWFCICICAHTTLPADFGAFTLRKRRVSVCSRANVVRNLETASTKAHLNK